MSLNVEPKIFFALGIFSIKYNIPSILLFIEYLTFRLLKSISLSLISFKSKITSSTYEIGTSKPGGNGIPYMILGISRVSVMLKSNSGKNVFWSSLNNSKVSL